MKANLRPHQEHGFFKTILQQQLKGFIAAFAGKQGAFFSFPLIDFNVVKRCFLSLFCLTLLPHADGVLVLPEAFHTTKWT